jgi:excisionase family DNA binding protein
MTRIDWQCIRQVADHIGMSEDFTRREITLGRLPAARFGRRWRVDMRDVVAYIDLRKGDAAWEHGSDTSTTGAAGRARRSTATGASARTSRRAKRR